MGRVLLAAALLAGCVGDSSSTGDAGVRTSRFVPQLCTSGAPGDPTCPINYVDLSPATLRASFVTRPASPGLEISGFTLTGSASRADGVYLELWCPDCFKPLETKLIAATLAVGTAAPTMALSQFAMTETIAIRIDVIH